MGRGTLLKSLFLFFAATSPLSLQGCSSTILEEEEVPLPGDVPEEVPIACNEASKSCDGNRLQQCIDGEKKTIEICDSACDVALGCVTCNPSASTCDESTNVAGTCKSDGSGYEEFYCDGAQGMACTNNRCEGACSPARIGKSYQGCDYYPTQTGNPVEGDTFKFAVAVSNTSDVVANINIQGGELQATLSEQVSPGEVAVIELPWVQALKMCSGTGLFECNSPDSSKEAALQTKGSYHLRTDVPVTVYQFSPLNYEKSGAFSYSNDASLLMPSNAWTGNYVAGGWPSVNRIFSSTLPSLLAVTAQSDNTLVTLTTRADTNAGGGAPAFEESVPQTVTLHKGDVLQVASYDDDSDLTGSLVQADKPVQVLSGNFCANVPSEMGYCDHIEESMLPVEVLGDEYVVVPPAVPTVLEGKEQVVRVVAVEADTQVQFEPAISTPITLAEPGDFYEITMHNSRYVVSSNNKVMVLQYMTGQEAGGGTGDPSLSSGVPVEQYRKDYLFHAPTNYEVNYVEVTGPMGAAIEVDGAPVGELVAIGESGMGSIRIELANIGNGNHVASGNQEFGITVYGYGQYTSYWYPGGLDLDSVIIE